MELDDNTIREIRLNVAIVRFKQAQAKREETPCRDTLEDVVDAYWFLKRVMLNVLPL